MRRGGAAPTFLLAAISPGRSLRASPVTGRRPTAGRARSRRGGGRCWASGRRRNGGSGMRRAAMASEEGWRNPPPEERLAGRLTAPVPPGPVTARTRAATMLTELGQVDRAVYLAVAGTPTPALDPPMRGLSRVHSRPGLPHRASRSPTRWDRRCPQPPRRCACSPALSATPGSTPGSIRGERGHGSGDRGHHRRPRRLELARSRRRGSGGR
jgi:hypothetical protein